MLSYIQINTAKAWNLSDSQGLFLVIQPNGSKLWRFRYRFLDKQKTLHLGGWPQISLADARVRRDEAKKLVANGIDPALEKKRARIAAKYAAANPFEAVAEEWLVKCGRDGLAPVTVDKIRWLLSKAYSVIGSIPIAQITRTRRSLSCARSRRLEPMRAPAECAACSIGCFARGWRLYAAGTGRSSPLRRREGTSAGRRPLRMPSGVSRPWTSTAAACSTQPKSRKRRNSVARSNGSKWSCGWQH